MASDDTAGDSRWECPMCGEVHGDMGAKVPGGCLSCVDLIRYIEAEAPGMGILHNDVAAVVCNGCGERVRVDPATLVEEDHDAVSIVSEGYDMEAGEATGASRVEIYCSPECRNDHFARNEPDEGGEPC